MVSQERSRTIPMERLYDGGEWKLYRRKGQGLFTWKDYMMAENGNGEASQHGWEKVALEFAQIVELHVFYVA
jgi:hypothetical protein